jgi:CBS domain-containing protein
VSVASILREKGRDVVSVRPSDQVRDVVALLSEKRIGAVLVLDGGRIAGVLSERDIVRGLLDQGGQILDSLVDDVMTREVTTVAPDESVTFAMSLMTHRRIRHLPVVAGGELCGIVSIGDLVKQRIEEVEREADSLKDYIQRA